ncbi:MAG: DUF1365 family protein [Solirubrobacterales bacterium]|nr:DUF1365 family protein [Solirubrobacterales bacterium]
MNRKPDSPRQRVAVVGSGIAGLMAAHVISRSADVTLFEADDRLGGHADTHRVPTADGELAIDTGFIVHNNRTYPTLLRLFRELGVETRTAPMSMSIRSDEAHHGSGLEYAGAKGLGGLFASPRNLLRPAYLRMLAEIPRFHRAARKLLDDNGDNADLTLREFLRAGRYSAYFIDHFMKPLVATVWSCDPLIADRYPARYLFRFLEQHGMLGIFGSPEWRTVVGGSGEYVRRIERGLITVGGTIEIGTGVVALREHPDRVELTDSHGRTRTFDRVVVATHPDQAVQILPPADRVRREILGAIPCSPNFLQLHTDTSVLPRSGRVRASWNHLSRPAGGAVVVTYDLTSLMCLPAGDGTRYLATLNAPDLVDPARVITTREYSHPIYTPESVAAIGRAERLDTDRVAFAGAWRGWGFHEDGARAGLKAAERLGFTWDTREAVRTPRIYRTSLPHSRTEPVRYRFTHRSYTWLVDLDRLPRTRRPRSWITGSFRSSDHLGRPERPIRENVEELLRDNGITAIGRVLMAAMPRAYGYCFNPLTVFWCYDPEERLAATVLEVQNTYGQRHPYVFTPKQGGRGESEKRMYVSPFHGTDGSYEVRVSEPTDAALDVAVTLKRPGGYRFHAALHGRPTTAGPLRAAPAALLGALAIRFHGIRLWAKRVPIQPRPGRES